MRRAQEKGEKRGREQVLYQQHISWNIISVKARRKQRFLVLAQVQQALNRLREMEQLCESFSEVKVVFVGDGNVRLLICPIFYFLCF